MKLLVLSDAHANYEALKAVLEAEKGFDYVLYLGDFVDYGPSPNEVIETIRGLTKYALVGNHDYAAVYGVDCKCGLRFRDLSFETREQHTVKVLTEENKEYLRSLKPAEVWEIGPWRFLAAHAAPSNPLYKYLKPCEEGTLQEEAAFTKTFVPGALVSLGGVEQHYDMVLVGHSHIPFVKMVNGILFLNPGSLGQPRDYIPWCSYAVIDDRAVTLKRLDYDRESVTRKIDLMPIKEESKRRLKVVITQGGPDWQEEGGD
ncbi:metallophosphoesterase [Coprothermobacteraceae bacterium]|nr:metallophosphoesterase [Coprothermobacteraceae bacterium]